MSEELTVEDLDRLADSIPHLQPWAVRAWAQHLIADDCHVRAQLAEKDATIERLREALSEAADCLDAAGSLYHEDAETARAALNPSPSEASRSEGSA